MPTRRQFLQTGVMAGAAVAGTRLLPRPSRGGSLARPVRWSWSPRAAYAFSQSPAGITKFAQPLRGVGPGGIPAIIAPSTASYNLGIVQFTDTLHPALGPTTLWGYNPAGNATPRHLGGIIVAQQGQPLTLNFTNTLPPNHILPVDTTIMGATGGANRTSVHLHGGFVPWTSDGGPYAWFAPSGAGPSALNATGATAQYIYPNAQSARMMWYHDHALGTTRLNAYAGLASAYLIRDSFEGGLRNQGLPDFVENGGNEIPLVIQDKIFVGPNTAALDPTWVGAGGLAAPGSLWYPHVYERARWRLTGPAAGGNPNNPAPPNPSVIPEMFGDTMLANGTVYPEATVEARRYRIRLLNACNARFLNLQLYVDDGSPDGITLNPTTLVPTNVKGPDFLVIGTEGGFLSKPALVPSNIPFTPATITGSLITAPAERWDLIVDFSAFANKKVILYNDAPAPFPMGVPVNDYFPGAPKNPAVTTPGFGPNTRQIMRFNVIPATSADPALGITPTTSLTAGIDPSLVGTWSTAPLPPPAGVPVRQLTLNETFDAYGRLIQMLGTNVPLVKGTFGRAYMDPATETPLAGTTEVWQIANLTADTHPVHFHLVNVQILSRQPIKVNSYNGVPSFAGPARGPDPTELGWKETVRMNPGEVTTVIMKFTLPATPALGVSPRTGGNEYVWHCHILEHEEHDMMRPLVVT